VAFLAQKEPLIDYVEPLNFQAEPSNFQADAPNGFYKISKFTLNQHFISVNVGERL